MTADQSTTELIPKEHLPSGRSRGKKALRAAIAAFVAIIALAVAFFLLFVRSRPAPLDELRSLEESSDPVTRSTVQQKQAVDALEQQSVTPAPSGDASSALQQLVQ